MEIQNLHIDQVPKTIANEWFDRGKNEETLFRFVSYWIVFNHLYNYGLTNIDDKNERCRIEDYCKRHMPTLINTLDFRELKLDEFLSNPVIPGSRTVDDILPFESKDKIKEKILNVLYHYNLNNNNSKDKYREIEGKAEKIAEEYLNIRGSNKRKKIMSLFSAMYTVRCNLFHGNKTPHPSRDYYLVEESASILEKCLESLIKETFK